VAIRTQKWGKTSAKLGSKNTSRQIIQKSTGRAIPVKPNRGHTSFTKAVVPIYFNKWEITKKDQPIPSMEDNQPSPGYQKGANTKPVMGRCGDTSRKQQKSPGGYGPTPKEISPWGIEIDTRF